MAKHTLRSAGELGTARVAGYGSLGWGRLRTAGGPCTEDWSPQIPNTVTGDSPPISQYPHTLTYHMTYTLTIHSLSPPSSPCLHASPPTPLSLLCTRILSPKGELQATRGSIPLTHTSTFARIPSLQIPNAISVETGSHQTEPIAYSHRIPRNGENASPRQHIAQRAGPIVGWGEHPRRPPNPSEPNPSEPNPSKPRERITQTST